MLISSGMTQSKLYPSNVASVSKNIYLPVISVDLSICKSFYIEHYMFFVTIHRRYFKSTNPYSEYRYMYLTELSVQNDAYKLFEHILVSSHVS